LAVAGVKAAVERRLRRLNALWLENDYDALATFFHPRAVLLTPGAERSIVGREAIVDGYRQFGSMGKVHEFAVKRVEVHTYAALALCHLRFEIDYEINQQHFRESGTEVYVLSKTEQDWQVVWRTQIAQSA